MKKDIEIVCMKCKDVPCCEITNPIEYEMTLETLATLMERGDFEIVYQTCPLDEVIVDGKFYAQKIFHQFRCTTCGKIFGIFVDSTVGGEIKENDKVFNPDDYADKKEEE